MILQTLQTPADRGAARKGVLYEITAVLWHIGAQAGVLARPQMCSCSKWHTVPHLHPAPDPQMPAPPRRGRRCARTRPATTQCGALPRSKQPRTLTSLLCCYMSMGSAFARERGLAAAPDRHAMLILLVSCETIIAYLKLARPCQLIWSNLCDPLVAWRWERQSTVDRACEHRGSVHECSSIHGRPH